MEDFYKNDENMTLKEKECLEQGHELRIDNAGSIGDYFVCVPCNMAPAMCTCSDMVENTGMGLEDIKAYLLKEGWTIIKRHKSNRYENVARR